MSSAQIFHKSPHARQEAGNSGRPTILILAYSDLSRDPRVSRQIRWLSHDYHVIAAGTAPTSDEDVTFIDLTPKPATSESFTATSEPFTAASEPFTATSQYFLAFRSVIARIPFARTTYRVLQKLPVKYFQAFRSAVARIPFARTTYRALQKSPIKYFRAFRSSVARVPFARATYRALQKSPIEYFLAFRSAVARVPFARTTYRARKKSLIKLKQLDRQVCENTSHAAETVAPQIQSPSQSEKHVQYFRKKLDGYTNYSVFEGLKPDLIIANDLDCLVLAHNIFNNVKIIFDAHEYAPLEYGEGYWWLNFEQPARIYFCEELLPKISRMTTVCQGIADEYMSQFSVRRPIEVVTNSPFYEIITPSRTGDKIRVVHHGIAAPIRKIELMAEAVKLLDDRFELFLMLVEGSAEYIDRLKMRYAGEPRIHFLNPVPMPEIARFTSQFDIGMFILEPAIFNYKYALPNKFFEFIQARLAIAIGPSPEMEKIVKQHDLGVVAADFSPAAMAESLRALSIPDIDRFKFNSHRVAAEFCAESNKEKMLNIVRSVLSDSDFPKPAGNRGD